MRSNRRQARGWAVWGEPEPAVQAYAAAGDSEAATDHDSGDVSRVSCGDRDRPEGA